MGLTHKFTLGRPLATHVWLAATALVAVATLVAQFGIAGLLGASLGFLACVI